MRVVLQFLGKWVACFPGTVGLGHLSVSAACWREYSSGAVSSKWPDMEAEPQTCRSSVWLFPGGPDCSAWGTRLPSWGSAIPWWSPPLAPGHVTSREERPHFTGQNPATRLNLATREAGKCVPGRKGNRCGEHGSHAHESTILAAATHSPCLFEHGLGFAAVTGSPRIAVDLCIQAYFSLTRVQVTLLAACHLY